MATYHHDNNATNNMRLVIVNGHAYVSISLSQRSLNLLYTYYAYIYYIPVITFE